MHNLEALGTAFIYIFIFHFILLYMFSCWTSQDIKIFLLHQFNLLIALYNKTLSVFKMQMYSLEKKMCNIQIAFDNVRKKED